MVSIALTSGASGVKANPCSTSSRLHFISQQNSSRLIEQMKLPTVRLHFHRSGNIQEQGEKKGKKVLDRNASDDDAGAATGTSILRGK